MPTFEGGEIVVIGRRAKPIYYPRAAVRIEAIFQDAVGEDRFTGWDAVPRNVEWARNNPRLADTCRVTLNYRDFPIDPRMLSAAHVQVYVADVGSSTAQVALTTQNLRFQGFVDVPESTLSADTAQVIFDCRDYTALYLNRSWRRVAEEQGATDLGGDPPRTRRTEKKSRIRIPRNVTLAAFIEQIRDKIRPPGSSAIESPPTVFDRPEVGKGIVASRVGRTDLSMRQNDSAWDVLTLVCELFGQVPVWDLDPDEGPVLRIRTPAADGRNRVQLDWGRNIQRLQFKRNLQAPERKAIRIITWNPRTGQAIEGLFPKAGDAAGETIIARNKNKKTLGENAKRVRTGLKSELKRVQYIIEGDYTQAEIDAVARALYDEQAQGRIMGTIETVEMVDSTFDNDLLDLSNGDRVVTQIGPEAIVGTEHLDPGAAVAYLSDPSRPNSIPVEVAQIVVDAGRRVAQLEIEFFVLEVRHTWDSDEGYSTEISFTDCLFDKVESA